ncbi:hypothetical protein N9Y42_00650 [Mariniblastus sp.]|nr:hypothetical protein [Mariniblastus sp.]
MVEAIEDLFVPVLVYNNKSSDAATLKKFGEPSWNNPVVRFLNSDEKDVISRQSGVYSVGPMATRMVAALKAAKREVPTYLSDLAMSDRKLATATFAMSCYWTGEARLGAIDGVMSTTAGWAGGLEVVQLTYDPQTVQYSKLVETAQDFKCATKVFTHSADQLTKAKALVGNRAVEFPGGGRKASESEQKYQMRSIAGIKSLPLTTFQSTKVNSFIRSSERQKAFDVLSPRQVKLYKKIIAETKKPNGKSFSNYLFPDDDSKLGVYQAKLTKYLE